MTPNTRLSKPIQVLLFLFLFFAGLYFAKPFLVPLVFGIILSMLLLPVAKRIEKLGINRGLSSLICTTLIVLALACIGTLLSWQISKIAGEASGIEKKVNTLMAQVHQFVSREFGINYQKQQEMVEGQGSTVGSQLATLVETLMGTLVDAILVIVYTFLILYYRQNLKAFVLRLVPKDKKTQAEEIIYKSNKVSFLYLSGLSKMIVLLWIMYGIGFWAVGVKNPFFFAVLCGLLEIVPFVGNLTGTLITVLGSFAQGGDAQVIIMIIMVYGSVQFLQTYLLEPLVVGAQVNLNPLFTILALVVGELVWGVPGMILAIPLTGITKIVCDNITPLKPYGELLGNGKKEKGPNLFEKMKSWFKKD